MCENSRKTGGSDFQFDGKSIGEKREKKEHFHLKN